MQINKKTKEPLIFCRMLGIKHIGTLKIQGCSLAPKGPADLDTLQPDVLWPQYRLIVGFFISILSTRRGTIISFFWICLVFHGFRLGFYGFYCPQRAHLSFRMDCNIFLHFWNFQKIDQIWTLSQYLPQCVGLEFVEIESGCMYYDQTTSGWKDEDHWKKKPSDWSMSR